MNIIESARFRQIPDYVASIIDDCRSLGIGACAEPDASGVWRFDLWVRGRFEPRYLGEGITADEARGWIDNHDEYSYLLD